MLCQARTGVARQALIQQSKAGTRNQEGQGAGGAFKYP